MSSTDGETEASMAAHSASAVAAFDAISSSGAGKTYTLHCHCKANIYTFGPIDNIYALDCMVCNCSICHDRGIVIGWIPNDKIKTIEGGIEKGTVTEYQFHQKMVNWTFCQKCGSTLGGTPVHKDVMKLWGVNMRCVEGVDIAQLKITKHNGKGL